MGAHTKRKILGRVMLSACAAGAALAVTATGADAVDYSVTCNAVITGGPFTEPTPVEVDQTLSLAMSAPSTVAPGEEFTMTIPAATTDLPADSDGQAITEYSNLSNSYRVTGGTIVAGSVTGGATLSGDTLTIATAGPVPPGPLPTPEITFKVVAGDVGTSIVGTGVEVKLTAHLGGALAGATAATTCSVPSTPPLSTTNVVSPGAPAANDDTATTPQDNATTIDVLANDVANPEFAIDPATLGITVPTQSGALADIVDGQVRYTPPIGFNGTDTFSYQVCSVPKADGSPGACDPAVVTVTVEPPAQVQQQQPPPAATAAPSQLPRTGPASKLAVMLGVVLFFVGAAAMVLVPVTKRGRWYVS